jgi:dGTPase
MITRADLEKREIRDLAPCAAKAAVSRGRVWPEKEHEFRTAFQRDRDRILHSSAFRRLEYKTQVFVNHEGDHYRTRLTHTLEVAQIARSIGRTLRLNEDLIEAISLAHDLGHGPFGHAGEHALRDLMKDHGGFEHNRQSLRIVEELEESYSDFPGLNLTQEVLDGLKKHGGSGKSGKKWKCPPYLEAQLADSADEIAYDSHDIDDGLRSGLIEEGELEELEIWKRIAVYIRKKYAAISDTPRKRLAIRLLINQQAEDVLRRTAQNIKKHGIEKFEDIEACGKRIVSFSPEMEALKKSWKKFLHTRLYHHYRVVRMTEKGERVIRAIFKVYLERPEQLPPSVLRRSKKDGIYRATCDYIAGMTDRFAQDEYQKLFDPYERV